MKKMMMMWVMALTTMIFVGCSKASKFERLEREIAELSEKVTGQKISDDKIKSEVEKFKKLESDEQEMVLKMEEAALEMLKKKAAEKK